MANHTRPFRLDRLVVAGALALLTACVTQGGAGTGANTAGSDPLQEALDRGAMRFDGTMDCGMKLVQGVRYKAYLHDVTIAIASGDALLVLKDERQDRVFTGVVEPSDSASDEDQLQFDGWYGGDRLSVVGPVDSQKLDLTGRIGAYHNCLVRTARDRDQLAAEKDLLLSNLTRAAGAGDLSRVKRFLAEGADPNTRYDALPDAPVQSDLPLHAAAASGYTSVVQALLDAGAEVTAQDSQGQTALDIALSLDNKFAAKLLEQYGKGS